MNQTPWIDNFILLSSYTTETKILIKTKFFSVSQNPASSVHPDIALIIWCTTLQLRGACMTPRCCLTRRRKPALRPSSGSLRLLLHVAVRQNLRLCSLLIQQYWKGIWDSLNARAFWVSEINRNYVLLYILLSTHFVTIRDLSQFSHPSFNFLWVIANFTHEEIISTVWILFLVQIFTEMKIQDHITFIYLFMIQFPKNWNSAMKAISINPGDKKYIFEGSCIWRGCLEEW